MAGPQTTRGRNHEEDHRVAHRGARLAVGGAGLASAQTEPVIDVDVDEVAPGEDVTIGVEGAEPDATIDVTIADGTATGTTDADGNGSVSVTIPDNVQPGPVDAIVTINGVEYPVSVVIATLQEEANAPLTAGNDICR